MTRRLGVGAAVLLVLFVAAGALIGVELGKGAARPVSPRIANPCAPRTPFPGGGLDALAQRVVLDGLDGAACRLGTSREELVLSLAPGTGVQVAGADRSKVEAAVRAGLLRSLNEAVRRGDVPAFVAPTLRRIVETAPIDVLIQGGISLSDLFG
jgi:hypothetical protein